MSDTAKTSAGLSEISHLFLTGVRERQTRGAARPVRTPPKKVDVSIDITPEEFARESGAPLMAADPEERRQAKGTIVLAHHLGDGSSAHVRQYARHLAARNTSGRIGLVEVTEDQVRLICFDASSLASDGPISPPVETREARRLAEALEEMSWDVDRWLIFPGDGVRAAHNRNLLYAAKTCVLLSTPDHDGVIACYRTLKGLSDVERPVLSLAVLNTKTSDEADGVYRKLSGVSQQFLNRRLESEGLVAPSPSVAEHVVMIARIDAQSSSAIWSALMPLVFDGTPPPPMPVLDESPEEPAQEPVAAVPPPPPPAAPAPVISEKIETTVIGENPMSEPVSPVFPLPAEPVRAEPSMKLDLTEVMDLPGPDASAESILSAVTQQAAHWIQCPVRPPMCPTAQLCVGRDGRLTILAVTGKGLRELRSIGLAYRWASENRPLIKMALPQLAIDATAMPTLRLYVDHADLSADILEPMIQNDNVTVQAYRKLKWGARTGLMLEAA